MACKTQRLGAAGRPNQDWLVGLASATNPRGTCRWGLPPGSVLSPITAIASNAALPQYVPAMMDPILGDYARNNPDARCVAY